MSRSRFSILFATVCLAFANFGATIREATERIHGFIWSVGAFFVRSIAYPPSFIRTAGGPKFFDPMASYTGPADHALRHEANVSRRSADRHI